MTSLLLGWALSTAPRHRPTTCWPLPRSAPGTVRWPLWAGRIRTGSNGWPPVILAG